jgi:hypothetical protein
MPGKTLINTNLRDALVKFFEGKSGVQGDFYIQLKPKKTRRPNGQAKIEENHTETQGLNSGTTQIVQSDSASPV